MTVNSALRSRGGICDYYRGKYDTKKIFRNSVVVMLGITISATAVANASYILPKSASPFTAYATQERYYNFIIPALSGDISSDMATIGEAQVGRTTSDLGYSEHFTVIIRL